MLQSIAPNKNTDSLCCERIMVNDLDNEDTDVVEYGEDNDICETGSWAHVLL